MKGRLLLMLLLMGTSTAYGEIYTWKDSRGTSHYTNSLNEIPSRYLKRAKVLDVTTGKTGGPAVAHPATAGGTGSAGGASGQPTMAPAVIVPTPAPGQAPAANGVAPQAAQPALAVPPAGVTVTRPSGPTPPRHSFEGRRGRRSGGSRVREE